MGQGRMAKPPWNFNEQLDLMFDQLEVGFEKPHLKINVIDGPPPSVEMVVERGGTIQTTIVIPLPTFPTGFKTWDNWLDNMEYELHNRATAHKMEAAIRRNSFDFRMLRDTPVGYIV